MRPTYSPMMPEREQLDPAEQRDDDHDRRVADREGDAGDLRRSGSRTRAGTRSTDGTRPGDRDQLQRVPREADDPVHPDHDRAEEPVVLAVARRRAGRGRRARAVCRKPTRPTRPRRKPCASFERDHVVDDAPAHQPEVAGVRRDVDLGDALDHPVADRRDDALGAASRPRACGAARRRRRSPRASARPARRSARAGPAGRSR